MIHNHRIKLFCLPYAGGSAMIYSSWRKLLHPSVEVLPIELAGRGSRHGASFYTSLLGDGIDDVFRSIAKHLDGTPFAIFGHSMGSLFAYEICYRILQETNLNPVHVFFSGMSAPHLERKGGKIHDLPDAEFQQEVMKLGGTPDNLFLDKQLSDIFTPILKSDYRLTETYEYTEKKDKLNCNITALWGNQDEYGLSDVAQWEIHTQLGCRLKEFNGGHFFIHDNKEQVIDTIHQSLFE